MIYFGKKYFQLLIIGVIAIPLFIVNTNLVNESYNNNLEVKVIWDKAPHNAFPDLIFYNNNWYCVFREADDHFSDDGKLRIIKSRDGDDWYNVSLLEWNKGDVRDPKLSITSDNKLMINAGVRLQEPVNGYTYKSVTWLSKDGNDWQIQEDSSGIGTWRWSVQWFGGNGYSVGYTGKDKNGALYKTEDGKQWELIKENFFKELKNAPTEAALTFLPDGNIYSLVRTKKEAYLGTSALPYGKWNWKELGIKVAGPNILTTNSKKMFGVVRTYNDNGPKTSLLSVDIEKNTIEVLLNFPSGGDTGYAGMVEHEGSLWVSYHSSHQERSKIYLAKIVDVL